jgi:integrase
MPVGYPVLELTSWSGTPGWHRGRRSGRRRWGRTCYRRSGCTASATHATVLLADGEPVEVVSERLGHGSATITLAVYQHVRPGMGREAADRFTALLEG